MAQAVRKMPGFRREMLYSRILEVLNRMPEPEREAFMLSHYEGKTTAEIGEKLGLDVTQASRLVECANQTFYSRLGRI